MAFAKIEIEPKFCNDSSYLIFDALKRVEFISTVRLYPSEAIITFNFIKASHISNVLNSLSEIGYREKEEVNNEIIE